MNIIDSLIQACFQYYNVISKKAFKTFFFDLSWYKNGPRMFTSTRRRSFFAQKFGASKALFGRIAACACLCKFSACLVLC